MHYIRTCRAHAASHPVTRLTHLFGGYAGDIQPVTRLPSLRNLPSWDVIWCKWCNLKWNLCALRSGRLCVPSEMYGIVHHHGARCHSELCYNDALMTSPLIIVA